MVVYLSVLELAVVLTRVFVVLFFVIFSRRCPVGVMKVNQSTAITSKKIPPDPKASMSLGY